MMNKKQLTALWCGIALAVVAFCFPPFRVHGSSSGEFGGSVNYSNGFHFVFGSGHYGDVDNTRLLLEMLIIAAATWAAIVTFKNRETPKISG